MLFDNVIPSPPTQPVDPAADALAKRKDKTIAEANRLITQGFTQIVATHNGLIRLVNDNPYQLTPSQVAATFGTRGAALLALAGKVQEVVGLIAAVSGAAVPAGTLATAPEGITYGAGVDGSLVVTEG